MCRWFAYISGDEECLLEDVLITPQNSITQQVDHHYLPKLVPHHPTEIERSKDKYITMRNSLFNMDGMGIAWYNHSQSHFIKGLSGTRPALYKSISPPVNDFNFRSLCANTASKAVFAHIRASSGSPVVPTNCHPFIFGRHVFMHNGVVAGFTDIKRELGTHIGKDEFANIWGSADSEYMAALYMTYLTNSGGKDAWEREYDADQMASALERTLATVLDAQLAVLGPGDARKPSSLNLAATDGRRLVCCRFRNHATEQPPSLYYSTVAGVTLNRRYPGHPNAGEKTMHANVHKSPDEHGKHVIVASEPTTMDEKEWKLVDANNILIVDEAGTPKLRPAAYKKEWDALDEIK